MSKDGMSRDGRKISPVHLTLKAGVRTKKEENKFIYLFIFETILPVPSRDSECFHHLGSEEQLG